MSADSDSTTSALPERDLLRRFMFEHLAVRGVVVRLDEVWQTVQTRRDYPPAVRQLMGQALTAAAMLHATIKFNGLLTLQLQNQSRTQGALSLLVVQCSSRGELRGVARWRDGAGYAARLNSPQTSLADLCGDGTLVMTLEPVAKTGRSGTEQRYQGIVPLVGDSFTEALEHYFLQSEQLPTQLHLIANDTTAAGFMVQRLPGDGGRASEEMPDPDGWNRVQKLSSTLTNDELYTLPSATLIRRLFHQETLRLFDPQPIHFRCSCSRQRTETMLIGLGQDEVRDILEQQGSVEVACEFCGMSYRFDVVDTERLFSGGDMPQPPVPPTRH